MSGRSTQTYVLPVKTTAGILGVNTAHARDYRHILVQLFSATSSDQVIKFVGSVGNGTSELAPDFTASASATNLWSYIGVWDLDSATFIP